MANSWFRLYAEFATDPKVQMMPENMQRRLVMLFCDRCCDVLVTLTERQLAFRWRVTEQDVTETKQVFMANGFIDEDWNIVNWNKRQFISDSSTERTRRYRERVRTSQKRSSVTVCDGANMPDTDTEQIQKQKKQAFARPDWIPEEPWNGWMEMRQKIRKPATDRAKAMAVKELETLRSQGHDIGRILDQSTSRGWTSLHPVSNGSLFGKQEPRRITPVNGVGR